MKKNLLCLGLIFGSYAIGLAQWNVIPSGTTADFNDIHFLDSQNGYCGGGYSYSYKTTNGGNTWTATTSQGFRDYSFVNSTYGFAASIVGQSMGKTTNGGTSWTMLTPPTSNSLWGVAATSSLTAYFVGTGGVLWKTTNGGSSFTVKNSGTSNLLTDIHFTSSTTGFIIGQSGGIRKTTDAGTTWSVVTNPSGLLTESCFVNGNVGYVVGSNGLIVKTIDGGTTWITLTTNSTSYLQSIHFYDVNTGIAVGSGGIILYTNDGGVNWHPQNSGLTTLLTDVFMLSATSAVVIGEDGLILKNNNIFVGIEEHSNIEVGISAYPNPVSNTTTVKSTNEMSLIEVIDITGKLVFSSGMIKAKEYILDLSNVKTGDYFISIGTSSGKVTRKLIKD